MLARKQTASRRKPTGARHLPAGRASSDSAFRPAFTLVELLVAIIIIAILMALLLPVLASSRIKVQEAKVINEIRQLENGITAFKVKFGVEPPSRITLCEAAADWNPATPDAEITRAKGIIKRLWPQFDFSIAHDINGNGNMTDTIVLNAGECLVFFLGGIQTGPYVQPPADPIGVKGFSKNPADPFNRTATNREGPFFEFDVGRFVDKDNDGMAEYKDSLPGQTAPLFYFSSYEGRGYESLDRTGTGMTDVYRSDKQSNPTAFKGQSFQIISPGYDGLHGAGGYFNPTEPPSSLGYGRSAPDYGKPEYDNLTNFSTGRLSP